MKAYRSAAAELHKTRLVCVRLHSVRGRARAVAASVVAACLAGCTQPKAAGPAAAPGSPYSGLSEGDRAAQPASGGAATKERPAALLDGTIITWDDLRPMLTEASGGTALQEVALDRILDREMKARGQTITPDDIAAERKLLLDVIVHEAKATPQDSERLLERVRRARGLGDVRFAHLLERNAKMRRMIAGQVSVSEDEVSQAFELLHGVKYKVRVIVVSSQTDAARLRAGLSKGPDDLSARFGILAAQHSSDPSAARGGALLDPVSPVDPAYPASLREALQAIAPGQMTEVVAVDRGFAFALLEDTVPADGVTLVAAAPEIREQVRARRERLAMDDLARALVQRAHLSALDRDLDWSLRGAGAAEP